MLPPVPRKLLLNLSVSDFFGKYCYLVVFNTYLNQRRSWKVTERLVAREDNSTKF